MIFLKDYLRRNKVNAILDFAPNRTFSLACKNMPRIQYTSADFFRTDMDLRLDVCDMKEVSKSTFDIVICSHVLEHVTDPEKAMREIFRILTKSGVAIIMVPLFWDVKETVEDPSHTTDALRLQFYGQEDHVRLFTREDFLNRLINSGFNVKELRSSDFDSIEIKKNAISDNSILYVCEKTGTIQ